jgi:hypothetical protein
MEIVAMPTSHTREYNSNLHNAPRPALTDCILIKGTCNMLGPVTSGVQILQVNPSNSVTALHCFFMLLSSCWLLSKEKAFFFFTNLHFMEIQKITSSLSQSDYTSFPNSSLRTRVLPDVDN